MRTTVQFILVFALFFGGAAKADRVSVRSEPISPIQDATITDSAKVELGKQLFFDPRLSLSGVISCNTCHNLSLGGTDNLKTSVGHRWRAGPVNSPTVFNSSLSIAQFWDGRAANLQEQAAGPIEADVEMAMPHTLAVEVIESIPGYRSQFAAIYGNEDVSLDRITDAIAVFEETLATPNSRSKSLRVIPCLKPAAAWVATTGRRLAARRFKRWASSSRTTQAPPPRAALP